MVLRKIFKNKLKYLFIISMKRNRIDNNTEFIKDGYDNEKLIEIIKEIREKYVNNNKNLTKEDINEIEKKYNFFKERYPFLFDMSLKKDMNIDTLYYMLKLRQDIVNNDISFEDASKKVGQDIYTKYQEKK